MVWCHLSNSSWLIVKAAVFLILLHNAARLPILVNPELITSMHGRAGEQNELFVGGVNCLVRLSDGRFVTVIETCDQVRTLISVQEKVVKP